MREAGVVLVQIRAFKTDELLKDAAGPVPTIAHFGRFIGLRHRCRGLLPREMQPCAIVTIGS